MSNAKRIDASLVKSSIEQGSTLLVCAYNDDGKFATYHLEGAISLSEFSVRVPDLQKDTQIVFYCG